MDVKRSNIPCRVPKSMPEGSSVDVKKSSNNVSVRSTSRLRRTANNSNVLQTNSEITKTPNSFAGCLHTSTQVRKTPNSVTSLQIGTEVRATQNSSTLTISSTDVRKSSSNSVASLTNSISKLSTSNSSMTTTKTSSLTNKTQGVKKNERKSEESKWKADWIQVKPAAPADPNLVTCHVCGRHFNTERITLHKNICQKTSTKKRRPFDPVKHRLQGTEAEDFLKKPKRSTTAPSAKQDKRTDWRKKHQEFITIVRAAREAQAHVARGGKLSDLPPPPSLNTDHLTPCPHCARKFNQGAAERHIPKCANIRSNKPAGGNKTRPGRR